MFKTTGNISLTIEINYFDNNRIKETHQQIKYLSK